jgi:protoporphyrinogen oxidase
MSKIAIIVGAGPAGLTAAYELLEQTDIIPVILEATPDIGGLSKTVNYKGNRLDIGPHRFFSKSERVMKWWQQMMPIAGSDEDITISYHNQQTTIHPGTSPKNKEEVMLVFNRLTRIYFLGKLFSYPIKLNKETIANLGIVRIARIGFSYLKTKIFPRKPEVTLEDFFINRFGKELYLTFFKDYTEKVWGTPTSQISAAWGAQRVKGLSLTKTLLHLFARKKKVKADINQKDTETSLIEKFLYPKYGPGQMWELVARHIEKKGGKILLNHEVKKIAQQNDIITSITAINKSTGEQIEFTGDYFISSMPVKDLVNGFTTPPDAATRHIADNLVYRDFIIVGLLLKDMKLKNKDGTPVKDNWLYIQEKEVKVGRLQVYNNWGEAMVNDPNTYWMGLEYFCNEGDEIWNMSNEEIIRFAKKEMVAINIINEGDVLDATVQRMLKTYPSYVGVYEQFDTVRQYVDQFKNLFLIGRNGMHKYNNQDHSMLTAMQAVENIKLNITSKDNIWKVNTEDDYNG